MNKYNVGQIIEGTITSIRPYGAMMIFQDGSHGLLHISEIANTFIRNISRYLIIGKTYHVKILEIAQDGFLKVSMSKISQEEKELYRNQNIKKTPIEKEDIDFEALKEQLPIWVKKEEDKNGKN